VGERRPGCGWISGERPVADQRRVERPRAQSDKPEDAAVVAGADLVVYNGGGYDEFFTKLLHATGTSARKIDAFDLSGHPDGGNEHVWYDLTTVKKVADTIAEQLGAVDPSRKSMFDDNAAAFGSELDTLAGTAAEIGDAHPGTKVVATEPVAKYLLDTAGLTDATPDEFSGAIEEETDPPVVAVVETTNLIKNKQVGVLVNNIQTETPITNSLAAAAKNAGVPIVDVSETLPQGVTDYVKWMTKQVDALSRALAG
jgi:zinc/manganese transport system substrate-binding protein